MLRQAEWSALPMAQYLPIGRQNKYAGHKKIKFGYWTAPSPSLFTDRPRLHCRWIPTKERSGPAGPLLLSLRHPDANGTSAFGWLANRLIRELLRRRSWSSFGRSGFSRRSFGGSSLGRSGFSRHRFSGRSSFGRSSFRSGFGSRFLLGAGSHRQRQYESAQSDFCIHVSNPK